MKQCLRRIYYLRKSIKVFIFFHLLKIVNQFELMPGRFITLSIFVLGLNDSLKSIKRRALLCMLLLI